MSLALAQITNEEDAAAINALLDGRLEEDRYARVEEVLVL